MSGNPLSVILTKMKQTYIIKLLSALFIVVLTGFASTSCSSDDDDDNSVSSSNHDSPLVGTWYYSNPGYEAYFTFNSDRTGYLKDYEGQDQWHNWYIHNFTWVIKKDVLIIKYKNRVENLTYIIEGNTLYTTDEQGNYREWIRNKSTI